jgi:short-subunit dehydrogenase
LGEGDLTGRRAVVTGASRGIGAAIARVLARDGAEVLLVARSAERIGDLAAEIVRLGGRATSFAADLARRADAESVARAAEPADILVNNAAVAQRYLPFASANDDY